MVAPSESDSGPSGPPHGDESALIAGVMAEISGADSRSVQHPQTIDRFRILRQIGRGGMGVVYLAEQDHPRRTVALKVMRPHAMTASDMKRFQLEADLLGRLQHPGIARIFEAGVADTDDGPHPYLAMEHIAGRPLANHARVAELGVQQRLALLADLCDAVQHAHQHGVIHRDLKPSNILVDVDGAPKILDFGIARAIDSDIQVTTAHTDVGQIIGTLPYMSPEQASGNSRAIDARTDVYSLGVIGYVLLTDSLPHDLSQASLPEALRIIREDDPDRPSTHIRQLRGDIDCILRRALEKEPERRYASAAELGADIRRHLRNEPIEARPASALYHIHKFTRRHRAMVAAACLALAATAIAGGIGLWRTNRARAESEQVTRFFQDMFEAIDPQTSGPNVLLRDVLDQAAEGIDEHFEDTPLAEARLRSTITKAYRAIGADVEALEHAERSWQLFQDTLGADDERTLRAGMAAAGVFNGTGRFPEAERAARETLEASVQSFGPEHELTLELQIDLTTILSNREKYEECGEVLEHIIATSQRTLGSDHKLTLAALGHKAVLLMRQGQLDDAIAFQERLLEDQRRVYGAQSLKAVSGLSQLATMKHFRRDPDAQDMTEQVVEAYSELLGPNHARTLRKKHNLASQLLNLRRFEDAERAFLEVRDGWTEAFGAEHPETLHAIEALGLIYETTMRIEKAEAVYVDLLEAWRRTKGPQHLRTVMATRKLGAVSRALGNRQKSAQLYEQAWDVTRDTYGEQFSKFAYVQFKMAHDWSEIGRLTEAIPLAEEAFAYFEGSLDKNRARALRAAVHLFGMYMMQGAFDQASEKIAWALEHSPTGASAMGGLLTARRKQAWLRAVLGQERDALTELQAILEQERSHLGPTASNPLWTSAYIAHLLRVAGDVAGARDILQDLEQRLADLQGPRVMLAQHIATESAALLHDRQQYAEALSRRQVLLEDMHRTYGPRGIRTLHAWCDLAESLNALGRHAEVLEHLADVLDIAAETLPADHHLVARCLVQRGRAHSGLGECTPATTDLEQAHETLNRVFGLAHRRTRAAASVLAESYDACGMHDEAAAWRETGD